MVFKKVLATVVFAVVLTISLVRCGTGLDTGDGFSEFKNFLYIAAGGSPPQIYGYAINETSGELQEVSGTPLSVNDTTSVDIEVDTHGRFLYVLTGSKLGVYNINPQTGSITERNAYGLNGTRIRTDHTGNFLYLMTPAINSVRTFRIDQNTGELSHVGTVGGLLNPKFIIVHPFQHFMYVISKLAFPEEGFSGPIDTVTGRPQFKATTVSISNTEFTNILAVKPTGDAMFHMELGNTNLRETKLDGDTMTVHDTYTLNGAPTGATFHPGGHVLYVAQTSTIDAIEESTGNVLATTTDVATTAELLKTDPTGKNLYLVDTGTNQIKGYTLDDDTQKLSSKINNLPITIESGSTRIVIATVTQSE